jgi:hypothetical protein
MIPSAIRRDCSTKIFSALPGRSFLHRKHPNQPLEVNQTSLRELSETPIKVKISGDFLLFLPDSNYHPTHVKDINFSDVIANAPGKLVKKGEILLRNGAPSDSFYYVEKGCLRSYTIDVKGKEHVFQFAPEDWIISDQESLMNNSAVAVLNIDAIEDSEVKVLKRPKDNALLKMDMESLITMNQKLLRK